MWLIIKQELILRSQLSEQMFFIREWLKQIQGNISKPLEDSYVQWSANSNLRPELDKIKETLKIYK